MQGGRSDETTSNSDADTITSSGTPKFTHRSSLADQEWQMNYIINRRDGLYLSINDESIYRYIKSFLFLFHRPKVKKDREKDKDSKKPSWNTAPKSRIDTNMVKLKLLDATRKAVLEKSKKPTTSTAMQTDPIKTKLCKDKLVDNQNELIDPKDEQTETDLDLIALKSKDGTGM